jgi:hypothetical protein
MTPSSELENLIETAKRDLAQRLSIPILQIKLVDAQKVVWSDSSLGCPKEGMAYAQVLTSGYLILLEYANKPYEYHAGKGSEVFYCTDPVPPAQGIPDNT